MADVVSRAERGLRVAGEPRCVQPASRHDAARASTRMRADAGYAMAALLVMMSVMAVAMAAALPVWHTAATREKEAELIFRGEQYARAVVLFQRRYGNAVPPNIDTLLNERFLRKRYKDPITGDDFQIVGPGTPLPGVPGEEGPAARAVPGQLSSQGRGGGQGGQPAGGRGQMAMATQPGAIGPSSGVLGVVSRSSARSLRLYNGRDRYDQWVFLGTEMSQTPGGLPGQAQPGGGRGGGQVQPGGVPPGGRGVQPGGRGAPPAPPGGGRGVPPPFGGLGR
jgi:type II secretory pathway pseudopilin PulG